MKQANILIVDLLGQNEFGNQLEDILGSLCGVSVRIQSEIVDKGLSHHDITDHIKDITCTDTHLIFIVSLSVLPERTKAIVCKIRSSCSDLPIIVVLEGWEPHDIVSIMQLGATDFIIPPMKNIDIIPRIWRLIEQGNRMNSLTYTLKEKIGLKQMVGESPIFLKEIEKIPLLAKCDSTVLISGETGTGKELLARAVHYLSPRAEKAFIPINCGAIPLDLIENELFGHERGAFTGASTSQSGLVEEADGGTLFLDEIDCLSPHAQIKLLRLLQEKDYRKIGSTKIKKADIRIISATNMDLEQAVKDGKFRDDLFYRLNIIPIRIPALRERIHDIQLLARHFLDKYASELNKQVTDFTTDAMQKLLIHDWPGNVRELENIVERSVVFARQPVIQHDDIALHHVKTSPHEESFRAAKSKAIDDFEKNYIQRLLLAHRGNITRAAKAAQKNRRAFWELIRKHKIEVNNYISRNLQ